jgi:hypothetical protein
MTVVLLIVLTMTGVSALWAVTTALVGRLAGATVLKVTLALGPSIRIARLGFTEIRLGLPISSSVQFLDAGFLEDDEEAADVFADRPLQEELPFVARLLIPVAGWIPVFLFAWIALGLPGAATELGEGFGQILRFLSEPAYPAMALGSLQTELSAGRWMAAAAVVGMKAMAINFLPLPVFAGGKILEEIASFLMRRTVRWPSLLVSISFFLVLGALFLFVQRLWKALPSLQ